MNTIIFDEKFRKNEKNPFFNFKSTDIKDIMFYAQKKYRNLFMRHWSACDIMGMHFVDVQHVQKKWF